jgi:hypothetical protein
MSAIKEAIEYMFSYGSESHIEIAEKALDELENTDYCIKRARLAFETILHPLSTCREVVLAADGWLKDYPLIKSDE